MGKVLDIEYQSATSTQPQQLPAVPPSQDPTPEMTYALLAEELNRLSMKERDEIFADIHGVGERVEEGPAMLHESMTKLEIEISDIHNKNAFLEAKMQSPEYVDNENFRLKFLRAHRFDPKAAAECLVSFFESKRELFGPQYLTKDITLEDLDEDDIDLLMRGGYQLLPLRDSSGRLVVSQWPLVQNERDPPIRAKLRAMFYICMVAVEDENVQKDGMVGLVYNVGHEPNIDRVGIWQGSKLLRSLPIHCNSLHYCYDDNRLRPIISMGMIVVGEQIRARVRPHFGSRIECIYKLLTFGIAEESLPVSTFESELNLSAHMKWMQQRRKKETRNTYPSSDASTTSSTTDLEPHEKDVLFGRGKSFQNHLGNIWCRELVDSKVGQYDSANKRGKTALAIEVVEIIRRREGRFLKFDNEAWQDVGDATARDKVSHLFRSRRRKSVDDDASLDSRSIAKTFPASKGGNRRTKNKAVDNLNSLNTRDKRARYMD